MWFNIIILFYGFGETALPLFDKRKIINFLLVWLNSMKTYVLLHLEHKNDVTIIVKLCIELRAAGV